MSGDQKAVCVPDCLAGFCWMLSKFLHWLYGLNLLQIEDRSKNMFHSLWNIIIRLFQDFLCWNEFHLLLFSFIICEVTLLVTHLCQVFYGFCMKRLQKCKMLLCITPRGNSSPCLNISVFLLWHRIQSPVFISLQDCFLRNNQVRLLNGPWCFWEKRRWYA